jgi:hypothetical protein
MTVRDDSVEVSLIEAILPLQEVGTLHLECHIRRAVLDETGLGRSQGEQTLPIADIYSISLVLAVHRSTHSIQCCEYLYWML